jgi:hypothetical protein
MYGERTSTMSVTVGSPTISIAPLFEWPDSSRLLYGNASQERSLGPRYLKPGILGDTRGRRSAARCPLDSMGVSRQAAQIVDAVRFVLAAPVAGELKCYARRTCRTWASRIIVIGVIGLEVIVLQVTTAVLAISCRVPMRGPHES